MNNSSPEIIRIHETTYRVLTYVKGEDIDPDAAYIVSSINDYVYPYRGKVSKYKKAKLPGLYDINGVMVRVSPKSKEDKEAYRIDRIMSLDVDVILKGLTDVDDIIDVNMDVEGDIFALSIKKDDDMLITAIKKAITEKQIKFNQYNSRWGKVGDKNNGRRLLLTANTCKSDMFLRLCKVFDLTGAILCWDSKDTIHPISKDDKKRVLVAFNGEELNLKDDNIEFEYL